MSQNTYKNITLSTLDIQSGGLLTSLYSIVNFYNKYTEFYKLKNY